MFKILDKFTCQHYNYDNKTWQGETDMDKDEILQKSRSENKNRDYPDAEGLKKASVIAFAVGCSVCVIISAVQLYFTDTINYGCWIVNFSILVTVFLVKYIKLKKRHDLALTIMYIMFFLIYLVGFIRSMMRG